MPTFKKNTHSFLSPVITAFFVFMFVFVFAFLLLPGRARAIGATPSVIFVDNIANGMKVPRTVSITRGDATEDNYFKVEKDGQGAKYIRLPSDEFKAPKGVLQAAYTFYIEPENAPNGVHEAQISFTGISSKVANPEKGGTSVSILTGVIAKVQLNIVDHEVVDFIIKNVSIDNTEVNLSPVMSFTVENKGNVDSRPDMIEVTFVDVTDEAHVVRETVEANRIGFAEPFKETSVFVDLSSVLPLGQYMASAKFFSKGHEIYEQKGIRVFVYPEGTLAQSAEYGGFSVNSEQVDVGGMVKLTGILRNTGQININPVFMVDVVKDGQTIDFLRSEGKPIPRQQQAEYILTFRPSERGTYIFNGYFEYGVKKTETKSIKVKAGKSIISLPLAIGIFSGLIIILIILLVRKMGFGISFRRTKRIGKVSRKNKKGRRGNRGKSVAAGGKKASGHGTKKRKKY